MLDPWIIEQIRRREEERRIREEQPLQIPADGAVPMDEPRVDDQGHRPGPGDGGPRGVVIIDFSV